MIIDLLWCGIGVLTFVVVLMMAEIPPIAAMYNSDTRAMVKLCRAMMKRMNPIVWLILAVVAGPFGPICLVVGAIAFDREVK